MPRPAFIRNRRHEEAKSRPLHEPHSQSGAKDARTPNAAASSGRPAPARSVWSACVFSAALPPTFSQSAVQGFKARTPSGNSFHELERRAPPRLVGAIEWKLAEAVLGAPMPQFIVPMRDFETVEALHELSIRSGVSAGRRHFSHPKFAALCRDAATSRSAGSP